LVERLGVSAIRPAQLDAFNLLLEAAEFDTKIIQGPTSMGKDMLPFMLSCHTKKAQLLLVPFTPLVDNAMSEGRKYSCNVVKFIDIGKSVTLETAAATADIIVCRVWAQRQRPRVKNTCAGQGCQENRESSRAIHLRAHVRNTHFSANSRERPARFSSAQAPRFLD